MDIFFKVNYCYLCILFVFLIIERIIIKILIGFVIMLYCVL